MREAPVRTEPHLILTPPFAIFDVAGESGLRNESSWPEFALIGSCTPDREDDNEDEHDRSVYDGNKQ
jgi:hypothetical protein